MDTAFDVVVLGAGPGGYVTAIRSAQLGLRTAIVEGRFWGGVCLNIGCIPAKALLRNAEVAQLILHDAEKFGVKVSGNVSLDYPSAYERSQVVADGRAKGVGYLMRKNKIAQFEGQGTFIDPHTMQVRLRDGEATLSFRSCIIATGATVKLLPGTTRRLPPDLRRPAHPCRTAASGTARDRKRVSRVMRERGFQGPIAAGRTR